ncbi:DUF2029 domain-containing protein [Acidobacteria bacterium ACD]|nr:MAG: DUF2029 domain-containing protein [Acidobacteriota bacterium]MDL1949266.1 DUF2029 domain-containing protein [Acidobacteria bacterium ACD]
MSRAPRDASGPARTGVSRAATALACLLVVGSGAELWRLSRESPPVDFFTNWLVARAVETGRVDDPWSAQGRRTLGGIALGAASAPEASVRQRQATLAVVSANAGSFDCVSTPLLLTVTGLMSTGDFERDAGLHTVLSLLCASGSVLALARVAGFGPAGSLLLLAALGAPFEPMRSLVRTGNVGALQLAGLAAALVLLGRRDRAGDVLAGVTLALGIAFKPNVALVAPFLVLGWTLRGACRRASWLLLGLAAGALPGLLLPVLQFGDLGCWKRWLEVVPSLAASTYPVEIGNFAPSALLREAAGPRLSPAILVLGTLAFAIAAGRGRRAGPPEPAPGPAPGAPPWFEAAAVATGCATALLGARLAWLHYFVLAIPVLTLCLGAELADPRRNPWSLGWLLPLAALTPVLAARDPRSAAIQAASIGATVALFSVRLLVRLARGRSG